MARLWTENLIKYVKKGEVESVKRALANGGRVDGGHTALKSPLHYAAEAGYVEIARLLCDHKADLELRSKLDEGGTALVLAVKAGHNAMVDFLLQRGADAQILDDNGESVAQHASRGGHTAVLEQLWKHSSLLTFPEQHGAETLLHLAAEYGHLDTVKWLVSHGHSLSCLDREKRTPADRGRAHHKVYTWLKSYQSSNILEFESAAHTSSDERQPLVEAAARGNVRTINSLIKSGINLDERSNRRDDMGRTALHLSSGAGYEEVVTELLRYGATVNVKDYEEIQPLHLAAERNQVKVLYQLVNKGASKEAQDIEGWRPVHFAAACGHTRILEELKNLGCDLEAKTKDNSTSLHLAAENNHLQVVQWLVEQGAIITAINKQQDTAEDCARKKSHKEVVDFLKQYRTFVKVQQQRYQVYPADGSVGNGSVAVSRTPRSAHPQDTCSAPANYRGASTPPLPPPQWTNPQTQPNYQRQADYQRQPDYQRQADYQRQTDYQRQPDYKRQPDHQRQLDTYPQTTSSISPQRSSHTQPNYHPQPSSYPQTFPYSSAQRIPQTQLNIQPPSPTYPQDARFPSPHWSSHTQTYNQSQLAHQIQTVIHPQSSPHLHPQSSHPLDSPRPLDSPHPLDSPQNRQSDLSTQMLVAAAEGRVEEVESCVVAGADLCSTSTRPGEEGLQALHLACWGGHVQVVKKLLELNVDLRAVAQGREGVHWAAFGGHVMVLRVLKDHGCDITVTAADDDNATPLHLAADNDNLDAVRWLVLQGVQINVKNSKGLTPVDLAMKSFSENVHNYFLEEQLIDAAGADDTETTLRLIDNKVNVDAPSYKPETRGRRALHQAADGGHTTLVEALLNANADPNAEDDEGVLGIHLAVQAGHLEVVKVLLPLLSDVGREVKGKQLIHWAAIGGHEKILQYLKTKSCNLQALTRGKRQTALHLAADNGNLEAAKWLVENGVNLEQKDAGGLTAEDLAQQEGYKNVALFLHVEVPERLKATPQELKFLKAAASGQRKSLEEMLMNPEFNINCQGQLGRRAIHLAASKGYLDAVRLLVSRGGQVDATDDEGNTAVHLAAAGGHLEILKVLRDNKCDLSSINSEKDTPLHFAARTNQLHVIRWLLKRGVECSVLNERGQSAEDIARKNNNKDAADMLRIHKGPVSTKRKEQSGTASVSGASQSQPRPEPSKDMPQGLRSLGNTCYMNSIIQCLYNTSTLTSYFLDGSWRNRINRNSEYGGEVAEAYGDVVRQLHTRGNTYHPMRTLKEILGEHDEMFQGREQQDAHDFLSLLLHALDRDLQRHGQSHTAELFIGTHQSIIVCQETGKEIFSLKELFSSLTLAVDPQNGNDVCTLKELLERYYTPHNIQWECPVCSTTHTCLRTTRIYRLPQILVIHLSKVNQSWKQNGAQTWKFKFPAELPMQADYHIGTGKKTFSLYGVCYHKGTMTSGHYTAICRDWVRKDVWYEFNDEKVTQLKETFPSCSGAHILFYENF